MQEKEAVTKARKMLQDYGFNVIKLSDKSTTGIPDTFISRDGKGLFIEFKFLDLADKYEKVQQSNARNPQKEIPAIPAKVLASKIKMGAQLQTLVKLDKSFHSTLAIIVRYGHGSYSVHEYGPSYVAQLLKEEKGETPNPFFQRNFEEWAQNPYLMWT